MSTNPLFRTPLAVRPPLLSREAMRAIYGIGASIWLTGAIWLLLHYYGAAEGDFGPIPHPFEFWARAAHGAFGVASIWLFGMVWGSHVVQGWRSLRKRVSGGLLLLLFAFLVSSGYLLYYLGSDGAIAAVSLSHWTIGLSCPLPFLLHHFAKARKKPAPAALAR